MKIGCAAWCFTYPHYQAPYEDAIRTIGEMGFEGLELIAYNRHDLEEYYSDSKIREIRKLYQSYNLELSEFVLYAHLVDGLASFDSKKKNEAYDLFEKGVKVGKELGADKINIVSHWIDGLKAPIDYPPSFIHPYVPGVERFDPKLKMELPDNFSWKETWENYVDSIKVCTDIAKTYGMKFVIEGHAHVIAGTTDALLRLMEEVDSDWLGVNFDTAWQFIQREYLPLSIHKLRGHIWHLHVRDGDGLLCYGLPLGMGVIDWDGVIQALKEINYDGFLSFEFGALTDPVKYIGISKKYLEEVCANAGVLNTNK